MAHLKYGWKPGLLVASLLPAAPIQVSANADSYYAELNGHCPEKHLDLLTPGSLDLQIDDFLATLPPPQKRRIDQAADKRKQSACATVTMGLWCSNGARISAIEGANLASRLARMVCKAPVVCRSSEACNAPD